ncbi:unnamed protein product [Allacma fusca]|uniref:Protein-cysteine N-palmitoyltransferase HHAT n=1 Tax=Allacma fusca TaxID=39272 RepID=A0A8J2MBQ5_9HEXA|nr:unnamed protein product [Allacma fusca]
MEGGISRRMKAQEEEYVPEKELHSEKRKMRMEDSWSPKKFKGADLKDDRNENLSERSLILNRQILRFTLIPRLIAAFLWVLVIAFVTYEVYLAAEEHLEWQKDPVMNPGPFTQLIGRGRDTTDFEWAVFTEMFFGKLIFWYTVYVVISAVLQVYFPQALPKVSTVVTFYFLKSLLGTSPTIYLFSMPVVYWLVKRLRSRTAIWVVSFAYLYLIENSWHKIIISVAPGKSEYYFAISSAWNAARCISFCFDTWDRSDSASVSSLVVFIQYCFYFPLTINGPLILFDKYEKHIILQSSIPKTIDKLRTDIISLIFKLGKILIWIIIIEIILHFLYFRPLALTIPALYEINWWALCGVVYWLGQFFQLKYVVMYGIPSAIVEFEGLPAPPSPKCIAYVHRYSVLWKDFDRGLYYFLVRYTYLPTLEFFTNIDRQHKINPEFRKLCASLATFIYVYIWHSSSFEVFVWAFFNFLGITIERIGSFLKRKIDAKYNILPSLWDVCFEPIFTIPLAIMSVINSAVFCGTLPTAYTVLIRFLSEFQIHYVPYFMVLFTNVGVLVRTWPILRKEE